MQGFNGTVFVKHKQGRGSKWPPVQARLLEILFLMQFTWSSSAFDIWNFHDWKEDDADMDLDFESEKPDDSTRRISRCRKLWSARTYGRCG